MIVYGYNDPSIDCKPNVKHAFIWNYFDVISPCYKKININYSSSRKQVTVAHSDGNYEHFHLDVNNNLILSGRSFEDPYFKIPSKLIYRDGVKLLKETLDVQDIWSSTDELISTFALSSESGVRANYKDADSLRINYRLDFKAKVEAENQLYLPFNSRKVTLVSYRMYHTIKRVEKRIAGKWVMLSEKDVQFLNDGFADRLNWNWRYYSKESPYLLASLSMDHKYNCNRFDFFHGEAPESMNYCSETNNDIYLFPNPGFGNLKILFENVEPGIYKVAVYNIIGKEILEKSVETNGNELLNVNLTSLARGTYLYAIIGPDGERIQAKKLVILSL